MASTPSGVCGLEVMLANGELMRTGMGALPGGKAWQLYRHGFGPSADGLFMQSNLGVVTKMGLHLMPTPEVFRVCDVKLKRESDLGPLIDAVAPLKLNDTMQTQVICHHGVEIAAVVTTRDRWLKPHERVTPQVMARMLEELDLGAWNVRFGLYGPKAMVDARLEVARGRLRRHSGRGVRQPRISGRRARGRTLPRGTGFTRESHG